MMEAAAGQPPRDRYNIVFYILVINGIGNLIPWNMFITAKSYFIDYKLSSNYTGSDTSAYTSNFLSLMGAVSQVPAVSFQWINVFVNIGGSLTMRVVLSIIVEMIIFILTIVLVILDTSTWHGIFYYITMGKIFILNSASAIYQNTLFGVTAKLPPLYVAGIILGNNICGTFTSIVSIISILSDPNVKVAAIYYFLTALVILAVCLVSYVALPHNEFYRYYDAEYEKKKTAASQTSESIPYWQIFKKCSVQCFNVFYIFFISIAIFPAVHSDIVRSSESFPIQDAVLYVNVMCFLAFNVFAMLGNLLAAVIIAPRPDKLIICVLLRTVFIPLFLLCNYKPLKVERIMPILIANDWIYLLIGALFAFTSGYFSSVAMIYCGKSVEPEHSSTAGMFGGACIVTGVLCGVLFSAIFPWLISVL